MAFTYKALNKQEARTMVRSASASLKKGEINKSQFQAFVVHGMAGEIRSTFAKKAATYNNKYIHASKSK